MVVLRMGLGKPAGWRFRFGVSRHNAVTPGSFQMRLSLFLICFLLLCSNSFAAIPAQNYLVVNGATNKAIGVLVVPTVLKLNSAGGLSALPMVKPPVDPDGVQRAFFHHDITLDGNGGPIQVVSSVGRYGNQHRKHIQTNAGNLVLDGPPVTINGITFELNSTR